MEEPLLHALPSSRLVCLLVLLFFADRADAQPRLPQHDTLSIAVEGKTIKLPCTYAGKGGRLYETWEQFVERDTCYLYRSIYYPYFENGETRCYTSSYYVLSHKCKEHDRNVSSVNPHGDDEYLEILRARDYFISVFPNLKPNRLGNMPRKWYPLVKYGGKYYYSIDSFVVREFYDKMVLFHGMEFWYEALTDFKRLPDGGWEYTLTDPCKRITEVSVKPARHLKGAYIIAESTNGWQPRVSLWTTDKDIKRFDIIKWKSNDGKEIGLPYEEIDFESIR